MPGVNLEGMNIGGKLTLIYVEASTVKNSTVNSDISAGDITLDNVKAKSLVSNNKDVVQNVKNSNIVWLKQGANHPVTLNVTDSTVGKIAPSNNGNTIQYIDTINLDGVTIAADEGNDLATGELILNGGDVNIKNSSVEKISIPKKPRADVNVTVEDGSVVTPISSATVTLAKASYEWTGKEIKPAVTVKLLNKVLVNGKDYTVSYKNNKNVGTATVVITGKSGYNGSVTKTFGITPIKFTVNNTKMNNLVVNKLYTKKAVKQNISFVCNGKTLKEGTDYVITYDNNVNIGKAIINVIGKGNYSGKNRRSFYIKPVKIAIKSITTKGNSITFHYYQPAGGVKYQVAYKQAGNKKWKFANTSKTYYKARYLKYNTKYYLKVRPYKVVDGLTFYGAWSDVKTKTIRK